MMARIFFILVLSFIISSLNAQDERKRLALLIGNAAYELAPLKNPVNDIRDLGSKLKELGFEVKYGANQNYKDFKNSIRSFTHLIDSVKDAAILFYYAGHAIQWEGKNYLIPIGAKIESQLDLSFEAIELDMVLKLFCSKNNFINIMILDVPPRNHIDRQFNGYIASGLAFTQPPKNTFLAFSEASSHHHSPYYGIYTEALLNYISTPDLEINYFFKSVRKYVYERTRKSQLPWDATTFDGEFYFNNH